MTKPVLAWRASTWVLFSRYGRKQFRKSGARSRTVKHKGQLWDLFLVRCRASYTAHLYCNEHFVAASAHFPKTRNIDEILLWAETHILSDLELLANVKGVS